MISSISLEWDADTALPMMLDAVKAHLQLSHDQFDPVIAGLHLPAAVQWAEAETHRSLLSKVHRWTVEDFPRGKDKRIRLPRGKTQSVASITYTNSAGSTVTLRGPTSGSPEGTDYREQLQGDLGGYVEPPIDGTWPTIKAGTTVLITFNAGWLSAAIPPDILVALAFHVGDNLDMPTSADRPPRATEAVKEHLLDHWKIR